MGSGNGSGARCRYGCGSPSSCRRHLDGQGRGAQGPELHDQGKRQASARPGPPAIYHVSRESGQLLFITTNGLSGWVSADQFVPLEEARVFFTGQIQANPRDSFAHAMRAIAALAEKPDFKSAMADLDEAVRLGPGDAFARGSRGVAWLAQQDLAQGAC